MPEPTSFLAVEDLDAAGTLAAAEAAVHDPRAVGQPVVPGAARLGQLGGAGTPRV
jgi:hypothetical protein